MHYADHVIDYRSSAYRDRSAGRLYPDGYTVVANQRLYTGRPPYRPVKQKATVKVFPVGEYTELDRAYGKAVLYAKLMNRRLGSRDSKGKVWNSLHEGKRWCEDYDRSGLRKIGFADEVLHLRQTGWYIDGFQDETYRGIVFQLPAKDGQTRHLAGYVYSNNPDAALVDMGILDDKEQAAYAADSMAERDAEREREYQETWQMGSRASYANTEALEARDELLDLLVRSKREGKPAEGTTAHALLVDKVRDLLEEIEMKRDERNEIISDAPTYDNRLREAFNEGYGRKVL